MILRYGSVCSGIEAVSVAWQGMGFEPAWFSEIEPFPCAVLAHHYPNIPNHGNMTTLPERILSGEIEAPDILVGGTPCLTPIECERLQGFPDNYTQIPWRNKPAEQCPDTPRYMAIGNSMAVPVMRWIGSRIK